MAPRLERGRGRRRSDGRRAAVKAAWKKVTPVMLVKISKRVRINMKNVIKLKGGNFERRAD